MYHVTVRIKRVCFLRGASMIHMQMGPQVITALDSQGQDYMMQTGHLEAK